jgi:phosphoglycerol geranylgeranyltransferase
MVIAKAVKKEKNKDFFPLKLGEVETYLLKEIKRRGSILLPLADPEKLYRYNITPEDYGKFAYKMSKAGAVAHMLGGSIGVTEEMIDAYAKGYKKYREDQPIILFPSGSQTVAREVDAIWFMQLRNSRSKYWTITAHMLAAPVVKMYGIEAIPLAYIVIEPGGTAGYVGEADLIPRNKKGIEIAKSHALAAQMSGLRWIYLEAGSGAPEPVPDEMLRETKKVLDIPLGTGGGIRTAEQARRKAKSGADYIFVGTAIEELFKTPEKITEKVKEIVEAIEEGAKKRKLF